MPSRRAAGSGHPHNRSENRSVRIAVPAALVVAAVLLSGCDGSSSPTARPGEHQGFLDPKGKAFGKTCQALAQVIDAVTDTTTSVASSIQDARTELSDAASLARQEGAPRVADQLGVVDADLAHLQAGISRGDSGAELAQQTRQTSSDVGAVGVDCSDLS